MHGRESSPCYPMCTPSFTSAVFERSILCPLPSSYGHPHPSKCTSADRTTSLLENALGLFSCGGCVGRVDRRFFGKQIRVARGTGASTFHRAQPSPASPLSHLPKDFSFTSSLNSKPHPDENNHVPVLHRRRPRPH